MRRKGFTCLETTKVKIRLKKVDNCPIIWILFKTDEAPVIIENLSLWTYKRSLSKGSFVNIAKKNNNSTKTYTYKGYRPVRVDIRKLDIDNPGLIKRIAKYNIAKYKKFGPSIQQLRSQQIKRTYELRLAENASRYENSDEYKECEWKMNYYLKRYSPAKIKEEIEKRDDWPDWCNKKSWNYYWEVNPLPSSTSCDH
jgi:hypothetical protein